MYRAKHAKIYVFLGVSIFFLYSWDSRTVSRADGRRLNWELADASGTDGNSWPGYSSSVQTIGYAISITQDSEDNDFLDGAAVLAYSIIHNSVRDKKKYDVSLIAFVLPEVQKCRQALQKLGFQVIETKIPVNVDAINPAYTFMKQNILKNGCCGAAELIKLESFRQLRFNIVVHLDVDVLIRKPLDDLFESMSPSTKIMFTTDPAMAVQGKPQPWQGGFFVIRPSLERYRAMVKTFLSTEFRAGGGWDSKVGWFYGGMTIQGFLPYYFQWVVNQEEVQHRGVDRCVYNSMADSKECTDQGAGVIASIHFTICQKPWSKRISYACQPHPQIVCKEMHKEWVEARSKAEQFFGLPETKPCNGNRYQLMDLATLPGPIKYPDIQRLEPVSEAGYVSG